MSSLNEIKAKIENAENRMEMYEKSIKECQQKIKKLKEEMKFDPDKIHVGSVLRYNRTINDEAVLYENLENREVQVSILDGSIVLNWRKRFGEEYDFHSGSWNTMGEFRKFLSEFYDYYSVVKY